MSPKPNSTGEPLTDLQQIMNVGPATAEDLRRIGIEKPQDLAGQDPYDMYDRLCQLDAKRYDPCVLDVFISAVEFVENGVARPWWKYTSLRKSELAKRRQETDQNKQTEQGEAVEQSAKKLGRRAFLCNGTLVLVAAKTYHATLKNMDKHSSQTQVTFGMVTDLHYADKPAAGTRHYRQTPAKLAAAKELFARAKTDFIVELGDFIDAADSVDVEKKYLQTIRGQFDAMPGKNHYVLGNHCVYSLTKQEFLDLVDQPRSYYSFDTNGIHFVVLDACFRSDGEPYGRKNFEWTDPNIPPQQLEWLRRNLQETENPTIAFIHQRLDVGGHYGVKNAAKVREVLERSKKVLAVFQGHNHKNDYREIGGIHYCTLTAMVDGSEKKDNAFATAVVLQDKTIRVTGHFKQNSYDFSGESRQTIE